MFYKSLLKSSFSRLTTSLLLESATPTSLPSSVESSDISVPVLSSISAQPKDLPGIMGFTNLSSVCGLYFLVGRFNLAGSLDLVSQFRQQRHGETLIICD